jgi:enterochelin esterase family protein
MKFLRCVLLLVLVLPMALYAAVPASRNYVSPEIHADHRVTFRILAPKASEVTLEGGWMAPNESIALTKDEQGMWSVTVGPLNPTVYAYWFNLDGAVILDQANQVIRERTAASSISVLEIPAALPLPWSMRDVAHGSIAMHLLKSATFGGETRNVWVYLPPGYQASKRYPVFYLFHGAGELHLSWIESGKANLIFDNLLADGKMQPMVVVMPYTGPVTGQATGLPAPDAATGAAPPGGGQSKSADYILKEIIPWTEQHYRLLPGRKNRAMAGLSAGGALTARIGFANLDLFSQLGLFSAPAQIFGSSYAALAKEPAAVNAKLGLLWIGVGQSDPLATAGLRKLDTDLTRDGIKHTYLETEGAHDYAVWRWCLVQFAPLLFQP